MEKLDLHYFLHGLIILMIGLLGGFPFARSIKRKDGREVAWRVVHSGSCVAGVMLMAVGAFIVRLTFNPTINLLVFFGIVISTYAFIVGMVLAAMSGERGIGNLKDEKALKWRLVFYLYGFGAIVSILSFTVLIFVCISSIL